MSYDNYGSRIVAKFHVRIVGWPASVPCGNPSRLTKPDEVRVLLNAWTKKTARWEALDDTQYEEWLAQHAEEAEGKPRKTRKDKGVERKTRA